ncbi:MAG TPA: YqhA family protein [Acidocella sp.]|nr:YqhA family protein [Acidocella sp.]
MRVLSRWIEVLLFSGRLLLVPIYLAMLVLLATLIVYFLSELAHALPALPGMSEKDLILLTVSLIDLSLTANLVVLVTLSGYENFVRRVTFMESDTRPEWLVRINFSGLKLRLIATITVIAAVHLLGSFLEISSQKDRDLLWQVVVVLAFAVLGLLLALTDRLTGQEKD